MSFLDFPSDKDWKRIYEASPFVSFDAQLNLLLKSFQFGDDIEDLPRYVEIQELVWQVRSRERDVAKSYVFLRYYFEQGIPDSEWYKSPGNDGSSIQFYPNFDKGHSIIKDWFDYYSDTFYHKLFSTWDIVGHILNVYFELGIKGLVYFPKAVAALEKTQVGLWDSLKEILNSSTYKKAKVLRNDVTHNYLPSSAGLGITIETEDGTITTTIGVRKYVTSDEIMNNVSEILELFQQSISAIIER